MNETKIKSEMEALNKRLLAALQENNSLIGKKPKPDDPDQVRELKSAAERLLEKYSVGPDAKIDESPEQYRQRKQIQEDMKRHIRDMGIKILT